MSKTKKQPVRVERAYTILRRPLISEKTTQMTEKGQIVFLVDRQGSKPEIKKAIESLFDVKVKSINTICQQGKRKRFRGVWGRRNHYKKAIITLMKGENIELFTGAKG